MKNYEDHKEVLKCRESAFELESEIRDKQRECINAFEMPGGMWDDRYSGEGTTWDAKRPKYTFDVAKKKVLKAYGEIANQDVMVDFLIRSDSSIDVYDGEDRMWVEWYTPNRDSMLVIPGDVDDDGFTIWVRQQQ